jgi:3-oxoacyl-[acyl-carrier-protein] synthase-3
MGTFIESVATARSRFGRGALRVSDRAARACLARAHRRPGELDLLVNAGIYREGNLAEPALASLIQEDLGANPGHPPRPGRHGTFSFDVLNGGCGVLSSVRLLDAFLSAGAARLGMVVAADGDPAPHTSRGYGFARAGGALLLAHREEEGGFLRLAQRTFPEEAHLFASHLRWDAARGRHVVEVEEAAGFARACVERAAEVARQLLAEAGLAPGDLDLLLGSQLPAGFAAEVAGALGVPAARVPRPRGALAAAHTAGVLVALEASMEAGVFARARRSLFVTAGGGLTVEVALYEAPRWERGRDQNS